MCRWLMMAAAFMLLIADGTSAHAAVDAKTEQLLAKLEQAAQALRTLAGDFEQRSRMKLFKQEVRSRGRIYFEKPRRIRWEYLSPDASVLVIDGARATLQSPGVPAQVFDLTTDRVMRPIFDQLFVWLGSGSLHEAQAEYEMVAGGNASSLTLKPRAGTTMARALRQVELSFDAKLLLSRMVIFEVSGDEKEIRFSRMERNAPLPKEAFQISP